MANNPYHNICRLCGSNDGVKLSMLDSKHQKYLKLISDLLNITIGIDDPLPKVLCHRCVIKIDDFRAFVDSSHSTQEHLRKVYSLKEQNTNSSWSNRQNISSSNINCLNINPNLKEQPLPADLNPPAIIHLNLLTCSNTNDNSFSNTRVESNQTNVRPRNDVGFVNFDYGREMTSQVSPVRSLASRGGSRPFPKKPGQNPATSIDGPETLRRRSSSDVEILPNTDTDETVTGKDKDNRGETQSAAEEKSSDTSKSLVTSPPVKKKKKYLSPFEVPSRRRYRNRRKSKDQKKPLKVRPSKNSSSSDEDTIKPANEVTTIPEKDLEKHFIFTKVPDVGMIYTCRKCEAIFTSPKAACIHTKCLNRERNSTEDEQDENSSSSESSDAERSDARY